MSTSCTNKGSYGDISTAKRKTYRCALSLHNALRSTHLPVSVSVDPCGMLHLITFTFKQTALHIWRQSAMGSDREVGVKQLVETNQEIRMLFVPFLY